MRNSTIRRLSGLGWLLAASAFAFVLAAWPAHQASPRPTSAQGPERFLAVKKWFGTYTLSMRVERGHEAKRALSANEGGPATEAFSGSVVFEYRSSFDLEFDEKDVVEDDPLPSAAHWGGFASVDHRSKHEENTRFTREGAGVNQETTGWKLTTSKGSVDRPKGPDKPRVEDEDPTVLCSTGRIDIDVRKGTYDFSIGPPRVMATYTSEGRHTERSGGKVLRDEVTPPSSYEAAGMGASVDARSMAYPLLFGPVVPESPVALLNGGAMSPQELQQLAVQMASSMAKDRYTLPSDGLVIAGGESLTYRVEIPKAPWETEPIVERCSLEISWRFTPTRMQLKLTPDVQEDYDVWWPMPIDKPRDYPGPGRISMRATLVPEDGAGPAKGVIRFTLTDVTKYPGVCLNDPPYDPAMPVEKEDLRFAPRDKQPGNIRWVSETECVTKGEVETATVLLEAYDTAAYGRLRAESLGLVGTYQDRDYIPVPKDENDNKIADAFDEHLTNPSADADTEEVAPRQAEPGDGMTLMDEYRGLLLFVSPSDTKPSFLRLNPEEKDGFVLVERFMPGAAAPEPAPLGSMIGPRLAVDPYRFREWTKIRLHEVRVPWVGMSQDPRERRIVSYWSETGPKAYALRVILILTEDDPNLAQVPEAALEPLSQGYAAAFRNQGTVHSPLNADFLFILPSRMRKMVEIRMGELATAIRDPTAVVGVRTLRERLKELTPKSFDERLAAVAQYQNDPDAVKARWAADATAKVGLHEMAHGFGAPDHDPEWTDPKGCLMRYFTIAEDWETMIRITMDPSYSMLGTFYTEICKKSKHQCWERLSAKP